MAFSNETSDSLIILKQAKRLAQRQSPSQFSSQMIGILQLIPRYDPMLSPIPRAAIATICGSAGLCSRMQQRIRIGTQAAAIAQKSQMEPRSQMNVGCANRHTSTTSSRMPSSLWTTPMKPKLEPMKSSCFQMTLPIPTGVQVAQKYLAAPMQRPAISITSQPTTMEHVASKMSVENAKFLIAITL